MDDAQMKEMVRARYGSIAAADASCCAPACNAADAFTTGESNEAPARARGC